MIADALRLETERFDRSLDTHPLMQMTRSGRVGRPLIKDYLTNLRYMLVHGPIHIRAAAERARVLGNESLCRHFEEKLPEEVGHHEWAERDISSVSVTDAADAEPQISAHIRDLVAFVSASIERDPALYLAYALFAEYFTVIAGPRWLDALEEKCNIPRSSMSAVANHVEADRHHVDKAMEEIDDLVGDPAKLGPMRDVVLTAARYLEAYYGELASSCSAPRSGVHVSAA